MNPAWVVGYGFAVGCVVMLPAGLGEVRRCRRRQLSRHGFFWSSHGTPTWPVPFWPVPDGSTRLLPERDVPLWLSSMVRGAQRARASSFCSLCAPLRKFLRLKKRTPLLLGTAAHAPHGVNVHLQRQGSVPAQMRRGRMWGSQWSSAGGTGQRYR